MTDRPALLIEEWLPFDTIGAESLRDASAAQKPPLYRLHVWWARRPLTVSRAAIVASVLPDYEAITQHPELLKHFPTVEAYQRWFVRLMGISGNPVETRSVLLLAKETGENLGPNPYGYPRAFTTSPSPGDRNLLQEVVAATWGTDRLTVLDPFAGGGAIPFEAIRYGFDTIANELNPVAAIILTATLDYPARFGEELVGDIRKWGTEWASRVKERLDPFFPKTTPNEDIFAYLWARTVACPATGKPVPLSPNWWLSKKSDPVAVRLLVEPSYDEPRFEIVRGDEIDFDPYEGTVSRGVGRSPWTGETVEYDYIRREALDGRMWSTLYAVATRGKRRDYRAPSKDDLRRHDAALKEWALRRVEWQSEGLITDEAIGACHPKYDPHRWGVNTYSQFFSPRQLLALVSYTQVLSDIAAELRMEMEPERASAIHTYLALALDKAITYNSKQSRYDSNRGVRNAFERHDFSLKWSFAEFDAASNLLPWVVRQVADAYGGLAKLVGSHGQMLGDQERPPTRLWIACEPAYDFSDVDDRTIIAVITDPPYYDNVMYAQLADFFYVWLKRTVGENFPDWFRTVLTNKDDEAVASVARFRDLGKNASKLADRDYERKMAASFREIHRVLRDDGVLTVMFTHKRVEAWDTLATALINAGFNVKSSWPVHTESEHSLHQAKKNAAKSTILLTCRKRQHDEEPTWWDDIAPEVRKVAREKATEFAERGITGVDLYISTFGPALSVISSHWPVLTSEVDERTGNPMPLRPEVALDLAREEVIRLRRKGLLLGRDIEFDPLTDWYLMAWDAFRAEQFPADEARKLALAMGLEMEQDLIARRVIGKKGSDVIIQQPKQRRGKGKADPEADTFPLMLDAVHTALLIYDEDGGAACGAFLKRTGLGSDGRFKLAVQAMINAIPRSKIMGEFVRKEAELLDALRAAYFDDLELPPEPEVQLKPTQPRLKL